MMVGISKKKLVDELKKKYPTMRNAENMADVIIAGHELSALDFKSGKSRRRFVEKGAKPNSVYTAQRNHGLLKKSKAPRFRIVVFGRKGPKPKSDEEKAYALHVERQGLYQHLNASSTARIATAEVLSLQDDSVIAIKKKMETGTLQEQIEMYDRVVTNLTARKIYNEKYDYYWIGFRYIPDKYWLSDLSKELLRKARI